jgi:hypothetical protein
VQWPSSGEKAAASSPSVVISGERRRASAGSSHAAGHAESVLEPHPGLERLDLLRCRQQEEVADAVQPDVLARLLAEAGERLQAARAQLDVELVGELRAHAARGPRGGPGGEFVALDQHHVRHSGARQVVRDARAHHPAADDDDPRTSGHPVMSAPPGRGRRR